MPVAFDLQTVEIEQPVVDTGLVVDCQTTPIAAAVANGDLPRPSPQTCAFAKNLHRERTSPHHRSDSLRASLNARTSSDFGSSTCRLARKRSTGGGHSRAPARCSASWACSSSQRRSRPAAAPARHNGGWCRRPRQGSRWAAAPCRNFKGGAAAHLHFMKAAAAQPNVMQATISRALDGSGLRAYMKYCILRRDP